LGKPTLNIGTIQGGTKVNVVPEGCEIQVDRRMLPGEKKEEVLGEIKEMLDSLQSQDPFLQYRMEEIDFAEPSEVDPEEEIVKIGVEAIENVMGRKPILRGFSGSRIPVSISTDATFPRSSLGREGRSIHTMDESVEVDALVHGPHLRHDPWWNICRER